MLTLALLVLLAQPPDAGAATDASEVAAEVSYGDAIARVDAAAAEVEAGATSETLGALEDAIAGTEGFGADLIASADGRAAVLRAKLTLASGLTRLAPPDPERAKRILDELLRTGDPSEVMGAIAKLDQTLEADAAAILARLDDQGKATIEIVCEVECTVAIDNRPVAQAKRAEVVEVPVYLGRHLVTVIDVKTGEVSYTAPVVLTWAGGYESRVVGKRARHHYRHDPKRRFSPAVELDIIEAEAAAMEEDARAEAEAAENARAEAAVASSWLRRRTSRSSALL